jgi:GNAT superfamily N-acetyltransferase
VIRLLSEDEFTAELVRSIFTEVAGPVPATLNVSHVVEEWSSLMRSGIASTWAAEVRGETVGLLGALFIDEFFTGRPMAMEQFWFVLKAHRGSASLRLFKAFEEEATRRGVETIWAGSNVWHSPDRMKNLYERKGFRLWGATYRKAV